GSFEARAGERFNLREQRGDAGIERDLRDADARGRRIGYGLGRTAAERGADAVEDVVAGHQRRLHISRKLRSGSGGRSRWLVQARSGPAWMEGTPTERSSLPAIS